MNPLFSIIIPTYNQAALLQKALESVINQSCIDWEAQVIDNYSTDETLQVVKSFNDPRILYEKIRNNGVIAASRNQGIRKARGEWVAFLDSDDIWYPSRLKKIQDAIKSNSSVDVWSTNEILFNINSGQRKKIKYGPESNNMYERLLEYGNCLSPSATVVRKSFLDKNNLSMREGIKFITAEDYDFWLHLASLHAKFHFLNWFGGQYTVHSKNNSTQTERHELAIKEVLHDHVFSVQKFENKNNLWKKIEVRILIGQSLRRFTSGKLFSGMRGLSHAFLIAPIFTLKAITYLVYAKLK